MEADLGKPLEEVFSSISERPIAAASLGQVQNSTPGSTEHYVVKYDAHNYRAAAFSWICFS